MDTARVDICYRPLRIAWAIKSNDFEAFRKAVRYSYALWGGRFNPIIFVDREKESGRLIDLFRVDLIIPLGDDKEVKEFPKKYPYLINFLFHDHIFAKGDEHSPPDSYALDINNALAYLHDRPQWEKIKGSDIHNYKWDTNDPLADVLLIQLGGYPDKEEVGSDYYELFKDSTECSEVTFSASDPIPSSVVNHPSIPFLSRFGMYSHHSMRSGRNSPGFFVGSVCDLDDLVCHWNLKACDIALWFIDPSFIDRYSGLIPSWEKLMRDVVSGYRSEWDRVVAIWTRMEDLKKACEPFGKAKFLQCQVSEASWNGKNVRAPMMCFGEATALGVVSKEGSKPKVSFSFPDKPFCSEVWFHQQHLVASVSVLGGSYGENEHTYHVPYLPELNEYYARNLHFEYDKLRVEPTRIGIIIDAADHDSFLYSLPVTDLVEKIFELAGYKGKLSNAGLITRQLITRIGGVQGGRVFKIPGVRRLLKTHGPNASITKKAALQSIGSKDPERPDVKFSDHENLFIEPRNHREKLTPAAVFGFLVEKGLFRVGADLCCPSCRLNSWVSLDSLKHIVKCELCGHEYNATRMFAVSNQWHYRRSGVLGVEKNTQGAVPVVLTLQQLDTNLHGGFRESFFCPSMEFVSSASSEEDKCEVDFIWIISRGFSRKTVVILGECKDQGPIEKEDVDNLLKIADSLPRKRFKTFIMLSQISPFTEAEIELAKTINTDYRHRAILISAKQLEPYFMRARRTHSAKRELSWSTPEDMANSTVELYFREAEAEAASSEGGEN